MKSSQEIYEASQACQRVLDKIADAKRELGSARNWGLFDMIGGGFFSSLIKHGKMGRAEQIMSEVSRELKILQKELADVGSSVELSLNNTQLNQFLDIAFDNIFTDWMTQSKIENAMSELNELEDDVTRLKFRLDDMLR